jgi:hypothetical protein
MTKLKLEPFSNEIEKMYLNGLSIKQISNKFNCYNQSVINLLKKLKVYNPKKINQGNVRYFQKIDSYEKAYFLGFITADGCLQDNGNGSKGLSITIHRKDVCVLENLKLQIGCENTIKSITTKMSNSDKNKDHVRLSIFNRFLYDDLCSYGLTERKSTTMKSILYNIPYKFRNSFILGYFDGDGSVVLPKIKTVGYSINVSFRGTYEFLKDIPEHLNLDSFSIKKDKEKNCFSLHFQSRKNILKFFEVYNNNNFYLARKHDRFLQRINKG